ncbi:MAG: histidine kinase [Sphingobacteriales bacterium]|nr:histidine kinase [Sphingobacteriales bacterium]
MKWHVNLLFSFCIILITVLGYGQTGKLEILAGANNTLSIQLAEIENSTASEARIASLKKMLDAPSLTVDEILAIQTTLVHQYLELQQWDICLHYCQQQIALAHQQNNPLAEATFYKLIGNTYYHISDKKRAVDYWEKSISVSEPNKFNVLLEQCYHNVGVYFLESGTDYKKAESYLLKGYTIGLKLYPAVSTQISLHQRLLATLYEQLNQFDKSEGFYIKVIFNSKILKDSANLIESLSFYSGLLVKKNDFSNAVDISREAVYLAKKTNRLDQVNTALSSYSESLFAAGRYKEAYLVKNELVSRIRERFNGDLNNKIGEAEAKLHTAESEHEKQLAAVKAKKEKQIYLLGFAGLLVALVLSFLIFYQKRNVKQKLQMQQAMQEEKERLSRDLHDNLGSQMALLSNNIENLDIQFRKQMAIDEPLEKIKETSRQLLQTLRETIWILNKEQVTTQEYFDKLIDYTQRYLQSFPNIQLSVEEKFTTDKILNSNEALQLFRICQEAIANSCKYAESKMIFLQGVTEQNSFQIIVQDFGKGFDLDSIQAEAQYGLKNMIKRAKLINADLQINTTPGVGTLIKIKK